MTDITGTVVKHLEVSWLMEAPAPEAAEAYADQALMALGAQLTKVIGQLDFTGTHVVTVHLIVATEPRGEA